MLNSKTPQGSGAPPKVSVCIDSYNYGRFLPQAIESVLAQVRTESWR